MEQVNLSTHSREIKDAYEKVVRGSGATFAVFTADKHGTVEVSEIGSGPLEDFVEQFEDGVIQFGLAKVQVPGSDVFKNLLLGWCPDNAPAKARLSYAANFADVSKVLNAYHVQVTARDQDDLNVNELVARVAAAAGARYTAHSSNAIASSGNRLNTSFNEGTQTNQLASKSSASNSLVSRPQTVLKESDNDIGSIADKNEDDDGWDGEKELIERDFEKQPLEQIPSAYTPTKVDINQLRKQKSDTISSEPKRTNPSDNVGSKLQSQTSIKVPPVSQSLDGRLTSLPKPKIEGSVVSRYSANVGDSNRVKFGARPVLPEKNEKAPHVLGGLSRDFGSTGGKTPAQLWAEKKGMFKDVNKNTVLGDSVPQSTLQEPGLANNDDGLESPKEEVKEKNTDTGNKDALVPDRFDDLKITEDAGEIATTQAEGPPSTREPQQNIPELPPRDSKTKSIATDLSPLPFAVAEYDYEKDEENEISFKENDTIVEIKFVDEEWWSGMNKRTGELGLFPASYVSLTENKDQAPEKVSFTAEYDNEQRENEPSKRAIAEFTYEKDEDNEIAFEEGDLIIDIEFVDENWWSGKHSSTGEIGLFPANYVKLSE